MKKIIFLLIAFISISGLSKAQIYFGANAGINMSNLKTAVNGKDDGFKGDIGYVLAVNVNIPVNTNLLLQTGLEYESYHTKINATNTSPGYSETINGKTHVEFLTIPMKLLLQMPSGNNVFTVGGGVYAGIGISGHTKGAVYSMYDNGAGLIVRDTNITDEGLRFGSAARQLKQMNLGLNITAAYLLQNNICFTLYTNFGLANLNNQQKSTTRASAAGIMIGYVFGRKTKKS